MKTVDDYEEIRKAYYVEGLSIRAISRQMGHSRKVIRKALDHAVNQKDTNEKSRTRRRRLRRINHGSKS